MKDENGKVLRRDFVKRDRIMSLMKAGLRNCELVERGYSETLVVTVRKEFKAAAKAAQVRA